MNTKTIEVIMGVFLKPHHLFLDNLWAWLPLNVSVAQRIKVPRNNIKHHGKAVSSADCKNEEIRSKTLCLGNKMLFP